MNYTLITGSSNGIGLSLAHECASRKMNLALVSLPATGLESIAKQLAADNGIDVKFLEIDLTGDSAADDVYKWCVANSIEVNFLINNAGMAGAAEFAESTPEYSDKRILLNIRALTMLCRFFVPMLERNRQSYILNIGSLSAFFPIPYKSVYSSTKSYVLNFSMSISAELRKRGISVTVICPNGVETNSGTSARIEAHKNWGKWTKIDSRKLASFAIDQTFKGKVVAIPMLINRFLRFIGWLIPASMQLNMLEKEFAAEPRSK